MLPGTECTSSIVVKYLISMRSFKMYGIWRQASIDTHTRVLCSSACVGLAQAHSNYLQDELKKLAVAEPVLTPFQTQDISSPSSCKSLWGNSQKTWRKCSLIPSPPPQLSVATESWAGPGNKARENVWRLIVDLSAPDTLNVKDDISPQLCSLEYTKISDVVMNHI